MARARYPIPVLFAAALILAWLLLWLFPWTTPTIAIIVAWTTILIWNITSGWGAEFESANDEFEDPRILGISISPQKLVLICLVLGLSSLISPHWVVVDSDLSQYYYYENWSEGLRETHYETGGGGEQTNSHYDSLNACLELREQESQSPIDGSCNSQISYFVGGMITTIMLAIGSLFALLAVIGKWEKETESNYYFTQRASRSMLIGSMIWYLFLRFGEGVWDLEEGYSWYHVIYDPGMGFWMAIIGGFVGLSAVNGTVCNRIFVYVTQTTRKLSSRRDLFYTKIALVAIPLSLLMPYLSIVGVDITGFSIAESSVEMMDTSVFVIVDDGAELGDSYGGIFGLLGEIFDSGLDTKEKAVIMFFFLMICFAPLYFIWTAIETTCGLYYRGRVKRRIALSHLAYFFTIIVILWTVPDWMLSEVIDYLPLGQNIFGVNILSLTGFLGYGFWIGGLSGFALLHSSKAPSLP